MRIEFIYTGIPSVEISDTNLIGVYGPNRYPSDESIPFLVEIKERPPLSFALLPVKRFSGPLMCRSLVAR